ncbi:glycoside hydrolase family 65 protein [Streptomyces sp. Rer75]|uniref:glycoside hydrolase family 65 protein n=1 Tax=Streptomyces sp. Rer75 TaxID=2750011 RepID=UPI0015D06327|nr:glycoside hydrolase family 65 protein [Streptomyces sp. Rer75]QLH25291.1 glycoside hydrolase family 65 protein [Streptomyces sp. Rer75]
MPEWTWEYRGYDPAAERLREVLCTLGNGYTATRGAAPESRAGPVHYPGTYVAGCYNWLRSAVAGREVENEDLVNLPNWMPLRFRTLSDDGTVGAWLSPDTRVPLDYRQVLDMRAGTLTRTVAYRGPGGHRLGVEQHRLVHMGDPHLAALRTVLTAEDRAVRVEVESALDGDVRNTNVRRYEGLGERHLTGLRTGTSGSGTAWLRCRTRTSDIRIALAAQTRVTGAEPLSYHLRPGRRRAVHTLTISVEPGRPVVIDKIVALHTSRDLAIGDPLQAAVERATTAGDFPELRASHEAAWARLWRRAELDVPGEPGRILRLHLFHVLQTLSPHTADLDVGVPARGLHGEAYRGHVFWDELFVLPYLNLHFPEVSRGLLTYRHRRLPQACRAARETGHRGAMYPWQSGSDGREETPRLHLNPLSGHWLPDHSRLQHHVNSAVAYDVWQYCEASGDTEFLHTKGAEMILQIARFWGSLADLDTALGRYRIRGVVGPDEYHDAYPDSPRPGLDDNAYTNVTAAWVLGRALELARGLPVWRRQELLERLALDDAELARWEEISRRLYVPFHAGVISQFDRYGELAELDWGAYRATYRDIRRLDRILEAEGDSVNRYQASKQADVLMLGYLFAPEELAALFRALGYTVDDTVWRRTVDYYLNRTSHGSTLSSLVHGWVLARTKRSAAWEYCLQALESDVADIQGGTTPEGIHLGAMAGTLDLVQRGLTGLRSHDGALHLDPAPLPEMPAFRFSLRYRGHWGVSLRLDRGRLRIAVPDSDHEPIRLVLPDRTVTLAPGQSHALRLPHR